MDYGTSSKKTTIATESEEYCKGKSLAICFQCVDTFQNVERRHSILLVGILQTVVEHQRHARATHHVSPNIQRHSATLLAAKPNHRVEMSQHFQHRHPAHKAGPFEQVGKQLARETGQEGGIVAEGGL